MLREIHFALRGVLKRPGLAAAVCGLLALGVACVTILFTFVNSILLAPLPFAKPEELVQLCSYNRTDNTAAKAASIPDVVDWKQRATAFSDIAYYGVGVATVTAPGDPEPARNVRISEGYLSAFGVKPLLGRWFTPEEYKDGPDQGCMISHHLWRTRFNSDPDVVGKTLSLTGQGIPVVGVMPPSFSFPEKADVALTSGFINWEKRLRHLRQYSVIGRLKPGFSLDAAQAELTAIAKQLEQEFPKSNTHWGLRAVPLKDHILGESGRAIIILFAAVFCVLIISCANIASLLLVRAVERKKDFAIRMAIGGNRLHIARQTLIESVLLALAGGAASLLASLWGIKGLIAIAPSGFPRLDEVHLEFRVLLFCIAVSVVCGIAFGMVPVLQTWRTNLTESLNDEGKSGSGSRRTSWMRNTILTFQVGITVTLMIVAGLFLRSYAQIQNMDLGFEPEHVYVSKVGLRTSQYPTDWNRAQLFKPFLARLEQLPEKKTVALATRPPFSTPPFIVTMGVDGVAKAPGEDFTARFNSVSPQYFETLGMRIVAGRAFDATDSERSPRVVIVNQSLARKYLGAGDPVGQRITVQGNGTNLFTIVGLVNDVRQVAFDHKPEPELYFHYLQINDVTFHVVAKVEHANDSHRFSAGVKKELAALDNRQAAGRLESYNTILAHSLQVRKFRTYLLVGFAGIALLLSAAGIFGFLSYAVGQRTREIGILTALGAPRSHIVSMMMKETAVVIALGVTAGCFAAFLLGRVLESFLFQVKPRDAITFVAVACFVAAMAVLAAYFPVRKATNLEPLEALRS